MKSVGIAELKARLSEHLRDVKRGHPLLVMDRDTPIARVVPYSSMGDPLVIRRPRQRYASLQRVPLPPPLDLDLDVVDLLLQEREEKR
jgi:prevent-host-death family protein